MFKIFEDNAGNYNLAWIENDVCTYYLCDHKTTGLVQETVSAILTGGDPISDGYDGGEENPDECYRDIIGFVQARNGGAWELDVSDMESAE